MKPYINMWGYSYRWATKQQLMHNLHYLHLLLISLFYSGRSDHPLLANHISYIMSKPITPPFLYLLYNILCKISIYKSEFLYFIHLFSILYKVFWLKLLTEKNINNIICIKEKGRNKRWKIVVIVNAKIKKNLQMNY